MNKVFLVLSIAFLASTTQQLCDSKNNNLSLAEKTQRARNAHNEANRQFQQAIANVEEGRGANVSQDRLNELSRAVDTFRINYRQTKKALEQAQLNEQKQAKACENDEAIGRELQDQENNKFSEVKIIEAAFARLHRLDRQKAEELSAAINNKYNGWW